MNGLTDGWMCGWTDGWIKGLGWGWIICELVVKSVCQMFTLNHEGSTVSKWPQRVPILYLKLPFGVLDGGSYISSFLCVCRLRFHLNELFPWVNFLCCLGVFFFLCWSRSLKGQKVSHIKHILSLLCFQMFLPLLQRAAKSCSGDKDGGKSLRLFDPQEKL